MISSGISNGLYLGEVGFFLQRITIAPRKTLILFSDGKSSTPTRTATDKNGMLYILCDKGYQDLRRHSLLRCESYSQTTIGLLPVGDYSDASKRRK